MENKNETHGSIITDRAQRFKLFAIASNSSSWSSDLALSAILAWLW